MSGITDIVQQHLTPETINQISAAIGGDPATTGLRKGGSGYR